MCFEGRGISLQAKEYRTPPEAEKGKSVEFRDLKSPETSPIDTFKKKKTKQE
jgi:hypothetical protein